MTLSKCCDERAIHNHGNQTYLAGRPYGWRVAFEWRRPKVHTYRAADPRPFAVHLNRYPGVVIGIAFQLGRRVLSILWGRPGRVIENKTPQRCELTPGCEHPRHDPSSHPCGRRSGEREALDDPTAGAGATS